MTARLFPSQAAAARRELAAWEKAGRDAAADGRLGQDELDFSLAAWTAILQLMETGRADTDLAWADIERAARANWLRRQDAIDANQDPERHPALLARAEAVAAILVVLRRNRRLLTLARSAAAAGEEAQAA